MQEILQARRPHDPFAQPDWRWTRANEVAKTGRRTDDEWVNELADYIEFGRAGQHYYDIQDAIAIRDVRNKPLHCEVEARVLTGVPTSQVAKDCYLTTGVVDAYCHVFFDVADGLDAKDWVQSNVIRAFPGHYGKIDPPGGLWRAVGYHCGADVLDAVMSVSKGEPIPDRFLFEHGTARVAEERSLRLRTMLFLKGELADTPQQLAEVLELRRELCELEGDDHDAFYFRNMAAYFSTLGKSQARPTRKGRPEKSPSATPSRATAPRSMDALMAAVVALP